MEVTLPADQWDAPPPSCPACDAREVEQQFKPVAINGSNYARAAAMADDIIANDYHAADFQRDRREGATVAVRYKDEKPSPPSSWQSGMGREALENAIAIGKRTRLEFGSGLDILQSNLRSGAQPDLIEVSKRRSAKIW